jgi:hypothetical protein
VAAIAGRFHIIKPTASGRSGSATHEVQRQSVQASSRPFFRSATSVLRARQFTRPGKRRIPSMSAGSAPDRVLQRNEVQGVRNPQVRDAHVCRSAFVAIERHPSSILNERLDGEGRKSPGQLLTRPQRKRSGFNAKVECCMHCQRALPSIVQTWDSSGQRWAFFRQTTDLSAQAC